MADQDVQALLGLMQTDAQATALANTVMHWDPDRFRTDKAIREMTMSAFEEALKIRREDSEE